MAAQPSICLRQRAESFICPEKMMVLPIYTSNNNAGRRQHHYTDKEAHACSCSTHTFRNGQPPDLTN